MSLMVSLNAHKKGKRDSWEGAAQITITQDEGVDSRPMLEDSYDIRSVWQTKYDKESLYIWTRKDCFRVRQSENKVSLGEIAEKIKVKREIFLDSETMLIIAEALLASPSERRDELYAFFMKEAAEVNKGDWL